MNNEEGNEKKSFFNRLVVKNKSSKKSSCCNIELEEITEEKDKNQTENTPPKKDSDS